MAIAINALDRRGVWSSWWQHLEHDRALNLVNESGAVVRLPLNDDAAKECVACQALLTEAPQYLEDTAGSSRFVGVDPRLRSAYCLPMRISPDEKGVLMLYSEIAHAFPVEVRSIGAALAEIVTETSESQRKAHIARQQLRDAMIELVRRLEALGVYDGDQADDAAQPSPFSFARLPPPIAARIERLSPRERDVLRALLGGRRTQDVAEHLGLSPHTVRNHLKAIYRKVEVHSQVELLSLFREQLH